VVKRKVVPIAIGIEALKKAANVVGNSKKNVLYGFFQRMNQRHGRTYAIKATANKIAICIYHMATKGEAFNYVSEEQRLEKLRQKNLKTAQKIIQKNGFSLEELGFQRT